MGAEIAKAIAELHSLAKRKAINQRENLLQRSASIGLLQCTFSKGVLCKATVGCGILDFTK
jgi:hypothetical protein